MADMCVSPLPSPSLARKRKFADNVLQEVATTSDFIGDDFFQIQLSGMTRVESNPAVTKGDLHFYRRRKGEQPKHPFVLKKEHWREFLEQSYCLFEKWEKKETIEIFLDGNEKREKSAKIQQHEGAWYLAFMTYAPLAEEDKQIGPARTPRQPLAYGILNLFSDEVDKLFALLGELTSVVKEIEKSVLVISSFTPRKSPRSTRQPKLTQE